MLQEIWPGTNQCSVSDWKEAAGTSLCRFQRPCIPLYQIKIWLYYFIFCWVILPLLPLNQEGFNFLYGFFFTPLRTLTLLALHNKVRYGFFINFLFNTWGINEILSLFTQHGIHTKDTQQLVLVGEYLDAHQLHVGRFCRPWWTCLSQTSSVVCHNPICSCIADHQILQWKVRNRNATWCWC